MARKTTQKYDPNETSWLVLAAKGLPLEGLPLNYWWIEKLTAEEARDELLKRFSILITSLVNVCITGRANLFQWPQKSFLRLFATKTTDLQTMACTLKRELSVYDAEELNYAGQLAILSAIERTNSNLVSTIIYCFKDIIYAMTKDGNNKNHIDFQEARDIDTSFEKESIFNIFLEGLTEEEWLYAQAIINGEPPRGKIPSNLAKKLKDYMNN